MQPRFTLLLLYLFGFFALFCALLVLPPLLDLLGGMAPGPEQEELAKQAAREAMRGKLLPVFALAVISTGIGGYYGVLPGLRR